ncbi:MULTISPECIES: hypothetical protein [Tenacibaculum]|uniref:hypothetical protein n=1 Tax=Tenacibaculum TaxID=104267 RepID=UPI001F0A6446|nr:MULTISPECIES: hypothetical protein [Tenacibaculum]MCH3881756.1 hypothetical protein [Tenacibaculum aquimarinum]MDO6598676.1 hypothetical protein [Tenacibaculum sp. 1_MG-2023]
MSIIDNISEAADKGTETSKEFVSKSYEYSRLKVFQLATLSMSMVVKLFVIGSLISLGFVFLLFSAAIALGSYFKNIALGYLTVGLFMLLLSLLIYLFRKSIDKKVIIKMSKIFFD